jgi:RHS repeat-associated protein
MISAGISFRRSCGDTPVATVRLETCGLSIFYIHTDHLNTPRKISRRSTAELVWSWESDPFGTTVPNQNPSGLGTFAFNLRFPGQYFDAETGLTQNYIRDYDATTGKYVESDPVGLGGGSYSTYAYAGGSPTAYVDPTGLDSMSCRAILTGIGALVGGGAGYACGCAAGGVLGGAGGTLVAPGLGTVGGAAAGCGAAGPAGAAVGAAAGAAAGSSAADAMCTTTQDPDRCEKAKQDARSRYNRLVSKRIPQYESGGTRGPDATHYESIIQLQSALKDAIRRVKLYCKPLP